LSKREKGVIFRYRRLTTDTNLDELGLFQKIIAVIARQNEKSGYNEVNLIKAEKRYNADLNTMREDLKTFLDKSLEPLAAGEENEVAIAVDSVFAPVLLDIINLPKYTNNYNRIDLRFPKPSRAVKYTYEFLYIAKRGA